MYSYSNDCCHLVCKCTLLRNPNVLYTCMLGQVIDWHGFMKELLILEWISNYFRFTIIVRYCRFQFGICLIYLNIITAIPPQTRKMTIACGIRRLPLSTSYLPLTGRSFHFLPIRRVRLLCPRKQYLMTDGLAVPIRLNLWRNFTKENNTVYIAITYLTSIHFCILIFKYVQ